MCSFIVATPCASPSLFFFFHWSNLLSGYELCLLETQRSSGYSDTKILARLSPNTAFRPKVETIRTKQVCSVQAEPFETTRSAGVRQWFSNGGPRRHSGGLPSPKSSPPATAHFFFFALPNLAGKMWPGCIARTLICSCCRSFTLAFLHSPQVREKARHTKGSMQLFR